MRRRKKNNGAIGVVLFIFAIFVFGKILSNKQDVNGILILLAFAAIVFIFVFSVITFYRIHKRKELKERLLAAGTDNPMQLTPIQYEKFCAALLENNGWTTELTSRVGDYGADIVATKGTEKVVVQCKQWTKSVGVKAVQEVHSAISYYKADKGIVVSTAGYTHAARKLALNTGIILLSHNDLARGF
ncbi:restriction endonuclease [Acidithiobacillus caldus]|uniref:restriction endonuclease n=1 Tax=Acidithiobacillus caldus TaxID=33059 RepID=UPI00098389BF|nr:restriction endonuclease [Acidithiobacillus caldus]